jgi:D-3-phosphoglycerate dehydrogenase
MKIFISTYPFGQYNQEPINILKQTGWEIKYNSLGRRLKENEVADMIIEVDGVIAGTEPYSKETLEKCKNLKVIARVGVGFDGIDFNICKQNKIIVTYTPESPADSVADLTIAQIINLLRGIFISNISVKDGKWERIMGKLIKEAKIGVLGAGRIGTRVINRLLSFDANLYVCDIDKILREKFEQLNIKWVNKDELFKICDVVTVHIPLNKENYHCIDFKELSSMKTGSFIINTSRGPIINEDALVSLLHNKHLGGAALDVFGKEPYSGPLSSFDNVILTAHIGASSRESRYLMELGAAEDCIRVLSGEKPKNVVPKNF